MAWQIAVIKKSEQTLAIDVASNDVSARMAAHPVGAATVAVAGAAMPVEMDLCMGIYRQSHQTFGIGQNQKFVDSDQFVDFFHFIAGDGIEPG